jgi:sterol desaturase/sphingolipid hydroxylase (fatty acid hydroxylase superfamily)
MDAAQSAAWWYWGPFLAAFALIGFWETFAPLRPSPVSTPRRWAVNVLLLGAGSALQTVVLRASPAVAALASASSGLGLLPRTGLPIAAQWIVTILVLDFVRYLEHFLLHRIGFLWRAHKVHHADPHYDLTTGLRFHPLEPLLTNALYLAFIAILGPPVLAVLAVEAAAGFQALFAHANADLPPALDRHIRRFWVTPNLHRIHHSTELAEQNSNFGMLFPIWDRLFGTYRPTSRLPQSTMPIGLDGLTLPASSNVFTLLALPFRRR